MNRSPALAAILLLLSVSRLFAAQEVSAGTAIEDLFRLGVMVQDTNGDKIADAVCGTIVVPASSSVAENTGAANLAARLGFETSSLTLPPVVSSLSPAKTFCPAAVTNLFIGRQSMPSTPLPADKLLTELQIGEGGVFVVPGGLLFSSPDPGGLIAAANAYAAHAPYQGSVNGERLGAIARTLNARLSEAKLDARVTLIGLTYRASQNGLQRAVLSVAGSAAPAAVRTALMPAEGESPLRSITVRELHLLFTAAGPLTLVLPGVQTPSSPVGVALAASAGTDAAEPRLLDLKDLYIDVTVLCTYKSGYNWIVDEIEPALNGLGVRKIVIEFAPYPDPTKQSAMRSLYRWNQELFPVDEVLARDLHLPLEDIAIHMMPDSKGPTYRIHAYSPDGKELLTRDFIVKTVSRPYNDQFPEYETVTVETGWATLNVGGKILIDERVESDLETFWDHYQSVTLPKIYKIIQAQNDGKARAEYQPLFDTLRVSYRMSEPDYNSGLEQERISSLEGLQEDTFFNTENFFYILGDLTSGAHMDYQGRILPVAYPSRDGEDGEVHIEFYAKDAGFPQGPPHLEEERRPG